MHYENRRVDTSIHNATVLTNYEANSDVVRKSNPITDADQLTATGNRRHAQRKRSTDAESCAARRKPEAHLRIHVTFSLLLWRKKKGTTHIISMTFDDRASRCALCFILT